MRWYNNGTYGWLYSGTRIASKKYDEAIWLHFDFLDLEEQQDGN